LLLPNL